ncbi:cyclase family protein [Nonomuraea harbinensis]|uniref:Cyclase family protein n=1 Tax=Nonomuraea harbinensis TaxID=1286938 RepID=A0ABW1C8L4_9ACTN|nr:cyclase family protein [Nonomuraea harbinensis]
MTAGRPVPTQDDVLGYFDTLSNWGRWGDDDELGTLNHITDDVRLAAARAVRHGRSVSCAWEVAVPEDMERSTTICPCADTATGSAWAAVTAAANGIVTRGVLLDVASARDVPWLEPGQGVFPDDLEEAERRQGVRVRSGDAVLLRTGYGRVRHETGPVSGFTQAGWHASCLPWLHEREVALIGADTQQDVLPSGYEGVLMPVHAVSLVAMGLWMLDNCDLEACATTAAELGQWDFHPCRAVVSRTAPEEDGRSCGEATSINEEARRYLALMPDGPSMPTALGLRLPIWLIGTTLQARAIAQGHDRGNARIRIRTLDRQWLTCRASCLSGPGGRPGPTALVIEPASPGDLAVIVAQAYGLTPREFEVAQFVARGLSTAEIATALFISPHTVRGHLKAVFGKAGISSRGELVAHLFAEPYRP